MKAQTMKAQSQNLDSANNPPASLVDAVAKVKAVIGQLTLTGVHEQNAWYDRSVTKLMSAAWRTASPVVIEKIESYFSIFHKRKPSIRERFVLLEECVTDGLQAFDARIAQAEESARDFKRAQDEQLQKSVAKREQRLAEIKAWQALSPEQRKAATLARKLKRFEKRARMLKEAMSKGVFPTSRNSCLFCGRGLHDPVSEIFGVGPDCRSFAVQAVGEQKALELLEELKSARKPQQPESAQ